MALVRTVLTAAITKDQTLIPVASTATGFPVVGVISNPQQPMTIDDEVMFVVQVPTANNVLVRSRGADGTIAAPHDINASVVTGSASDFPANGVGFVQMRPFTSPDLATYGQSGAITVPVEDVTNVRLAAATAGAYTLGAPSLALDGIQMTIFSSTAAAHVITAGVTGSTGLFQTNASGGPFGTATFSGQIGSSITLIAQGGFWSVQTTPNGVTIS